ncbi:MAG: hypothetical protein HG450_003085 [Clostridiales bacterium]|jgi:hypothetical protein|nr:hypothetical protein [Clostridiales bacterium]
MNVIIRYKENILFNPDAIYCEGVTVKAKKGLDYYILCEYEDVESAERLVFEIWSQLSKYKNKDNMFISIK